jgi:hypothetical protein
MLVPKPVKRRASGVSGLFREEGDTSQSCILVWSEGRAAATYPGPPLNHAVIGALRGSISSAST